MLRDTGALIIRIGFRGPFFYKYNTDPPPPNSIGNYLGPCSSDSRFRLLFLELLLPTAPLRHGQKT